MFLQCISFRVYQFNSIKKGGSAHSNTQLTQLGVESAASVAGDLVGSGSYFPWLEFPCRIRLILNQQQMFAVLQRGRRYGSIVKVVDLPRKRCLLLQWQHEDFFPACTSDDDGSGQLPSYQRSNNYVRLCSCPRMHRQQCNDGTDLLKRKHSLCRYISFELCFFRSFSIQISYLFLFSSHRFYRETSCCVLGACNIGACMCASVYTGATKQFNMYIYSVCVCVTMCDIVYCHDVNLCLQLTLCLCGLQLLRRWYMNIVSLILIKI